MLFIPELKLKLKNRRDYPREVICLAIKQLIVLTYTF